VECAEHYVLPPKISKELSRRRRFTSCPLSMPVQHANDFIRTAIAKCIQHTNSDSKIR
jgi:hypothetical protein